MNTVRIDKIMDTYVYSIVGKGANGRSTQIYMIYYTDLNYQKFFVDFNPFEKIPLDAQITNVILNLYQTTRIYLWKQNPSNRDSVLYDESLNIDLYTALSPWDEYTLTFDNAPKLELLKKDFLILSNSNGNLNVDLTEYWDKRKYGFVFVINNGINNKFINDTRYNKDPNVYPYYIFNDACVILNSNENVSPNYATVTYSMNRLQQPVIMDPKSGDVINKADNLTVKIEWESAGQAGFELQYSQDNYTWNSIKQNSTNKFYNFNLNNIQQGNLYIKLRIKDNDGIYSDFSTPLFIQIGERPETPIVTVSGASTSTPKVMWDTIEGQYGYEVEIYKNIELIEDSGNVNGDINNYNVKTRLTNNTIYKVKVKIRNEYGIWSLYGEKDITIIFKMPPKPIVTTYIDTIRGSIKLDINNPNPQENEEQAVYNEVYRREKGAANWLRIATNITNSFVDYTPMHDTFYEYFVRAIGENGYKDSDIINSKVKIRNSQIAIVGDYDNWVKLAYNPERQRTQGYKGILLEFSGRKDPVPEFKQNYSKNIKLSFTIKDEKELNKLQNIIDSMKTLLYRDNKKQCVFGIVPEGLQIKETQIGWWDVEFNFVKTFYQEEA